MIKAYVGSGGKTTLLKQEAQAYREQGLKVFVTTSTHMFIEEDTLLTDDAETIIRALESTGYVMAGLPDGVKIKSLSEETYLSVCNHADVVLVEADGSKRLPVKFPIEGEPVINENVDEITVVCGLHALGKPVFEVAHRLEAVKQCLKAADDTIVTAEHIQTLVTEGYLKPLREKYPEKTVKVVAIHDNSLYQRAVAGLLRAEMDVSLIDENWFQSQPKLVICGGGHVSCELAKMASSLDFYIKVLDDREEFANRERFPLADEVICDSFQNFEQHLEPDAYYVVVTRGHKDDFECVKRILCTPYRYLGMIGSKLKVGKTFERLLDEGFTQKQIETIFAPIGLSINAVTPAEIAISILAQIVMEKNKKHVASASRELLGVQEHGTLCVIIEKHGSSPRGVGSMMFVGENRVIDSIGGGAVEFAAISDAREISAAMLREYHLNNKDSERLGMICGGSNRVLFIPI